MVSFITAMNASTSCNGDVRRGANVIHFVLLQRGMSQRDLLLIVDPVLIVGAEAGVQNPLPKTQVAVLQVLRNGIAFGRARVTGEVGNAGDDAAAPVLDNLLGLVRESTSPASRRYRWSSSVSPALIFKLSRS
jgi:hypothetical protein